jgi:hypothetical protein
MKKYRLRIAINVEDVETQREAEPPTDYYYGKASQIMFDAEQLIAECIKDLNDPEWCKEYDEL